MDEMLKSVFGEDAITFDEFQERLEGASLSEFFVDKADYDILMDSYRQLNERAAAYEPDWEEKARKIVFDGALDCALCNCDARDKELVRKLLNFDDLEYDGGSIVGLEEQLEQLRENHSYLFENATPIPAFGRSTQGIESKKFKTNTNTQTNSVLRAVFGRK